MLKQKHRTEKKKAQQVTALMKGNPNGQCDDFRMLLSKNRYFAVPFILIVTFLLILLGIYGNDRMFLFVNNSHCRSADILFLILTNLGDGAVAVVLMVVLLWVSYRDALTFMVITILLTIIVTFLKKIIFPEFDRPVTYFGSSELLRLVSGYDPPKLHSFPSGHAATAFSVYLYLAFLSKRNIVKLTLFIIAFFVALSRVYLSAHFPRDVVAGALIAVVMTFICYYWSRKIKVSGIDKKLVFGTKVFTKQKAV